MTKEELITKIQEKCDRDTIGWWIFKLKSTYRLTKTEPHFVVQTIAQLPDEFKSFQFPEPELVLNEQGVLIRKKRYPWPEILVTAILNDPSSGFYLVLGLADGRLIEGHIGGPKIGNRITWGDVWEFGHMVEFYKRKAKKLNENL